MNILFFRYSIKNLPQIKQYINKNTEKYTEFLVCAFERLDYMSLCFSDYKMYICGYDKYNKYIYNKVYFICG